MIPLPRVEGRPAEALGTRNVRVGRKVQRTGRGHDRPSLEILRQAVELPAAPGLSAAPGRYAAPGLLAAPGLPAGRDMPATAAVVPVHVLDPAAVPDVLVHAVLAGAHLQVLPDLPPGREHPAPRRVQLEGVGIQRRRHVAGAARVLVVVPGPAEVVAFLQDHEVAEA